MFKQQVTEVYTFSANAKDQWQNDHGPNSVWQTAIHLGTDHCSGSLGAVYLKYRNTSKWCISSTWGT